MICNTLEITGSAQQPLPIFRRDVTVPAVTSSLASLAGRRVLGLLDIENLHYSARDLDRRVDYRALREHLDEASDQCGLHAFYSRGADDAHLDTAFEQLGFRPHPRLLVKRRLRGGYQGGANSDGNLLFMGGFLARTSRCDTVLVASGDGELVCQLAESLGALRKQRGIVSLSLPGATSARIWADQHPLIDANILLGGDVLVERDPDDADDERRYGLPVD